MGFQNKNIAVRWSDIFDPAPSTPGPIIWSSSSVTSYLPSQVPRFLKFVSYGRCTMRV